MTLPPRSPAPVHDLDDLDAQNTRHFGYARPCCVLTIFWLAALCLLTAFAGAVAWWLL